MKKVPFKVLVSLSERRKVVLIMCQVLHTGTDFCTSSWASMTHGPRLL